MESETREKTSESPFAFIANKLRSIPLVSAGMSREELERLRAEQSVPEKSPEGSTIAAHSASLGSSNRYSKSTVKPEVAEMALLKRHQSFIEKRDTPPLQEKLGDRIQNQSEILFRPNGITASTANVMREQSSPRIMPTSTRRPAQTTTKPPTRRTTTPKVVRITTTTTRRRLVTSSTTRRPRQNNLRQAKQTIPAQGIIITSSPAPITTTTTTDVPALRRNQAQQEALDQAAIQTSSTSAATPTFKTIEPITSYQASTLKVLATSQDDTRGRTNQATVSRPNMSSSGGISMGQQQTIGGKVQQQQTTSSIQLNRATQSQLASLSTVPVNQRRHQQPVLNLNTGSSGSTARSSGVRYALKNQYDNDPLRGAGEKWALFKRPDGRFSLFESLVLASNVLIVATVVIVILFNLIRSMKKKRSQLMARSQQASPATLETGSQRRNSRASTLRTETPADGNKTKALGLNDAQSHSRISMISSGLPSQTSEPATGAGQINSIVTGKTETGNSTSAPLDMVNRGQQANTNPKQKSDTVQQNVISSELRNASNQVVSKAMAIVQPSAESQLNNSRSELRKDLEDLKADLKQDLLAGSAGPVASVANHIQKPINRSLSDLSGGSAAALSAKEELKKLASDDLCSKPSDQTRIDALEELFINGSSNKLSKQRESNPINEPDGKGLAQSEKKPMQQSTNSLDSIELPENLANDDNKSANKPKILKKKAPDELQIAPSPNLLLGQGEPESVSSNPPMEMSSKNHPKTIMEEPENDTKEELKSVTKVEAGGSKVRNGATDAARTAPSPEQRPENPMGREDQSPPAEQKQSESQSVVEEQKRQADEQRPKLEKKKQKEGVKEESVGKTVGSECNSHVATEVKNHQVVVNKLDKRKTNLEIVDLRDESVTGKMRSMKGGDQQPSSSGSQLSPDQQQMDGWISMDGVAVVQAAPPAASNQANDGSSPAGDSAAPSRMGPSQQTALPMSPSEIIESRFHVDYSSGSAKKRRSAKVGDSEGGNEGATNQGPSTTSGGTANGAAAKGSAKNQDSVDSKQEEYVFNNIENELEQDNKMRNRKYFVYIVHDGHFTSKKECIARIELPPKRRITLAELRQLISSSQDISLSSLRRNRFKFVTETYRLLNENEDAAVLHQVYPTQGVFLKLNVTDNQESHGYGFKGSRPSPRLSSGSGGATGGLLSGNSNGAPNSVSQATIASRRRANARSGGRKLNTTSGQDGNMLPAIEIDYAGSSRSSARDRASSVGRRPSGAGPAGAYRRSKSSVMVGRQRSNMGGQRQGGGMQRGASSSNISNQGNENNQRLPPIGRSNGSEDQYRRRASKANLGGKRVSKPSGTGVVAASKQALGNAASDLGANMLSGAKKLFNSTFSSANK